VDGVFFFGDLVARRRLNYENAGYNLDDNSFGQIFWDF
jgi:hypothetical protein